MNNKLQADTLPSPPTEKAQQNSMFRNVGANWLGHFVFIVGGFLLPRMIGDHLGQERLGVWDFGWATVSYLNLLTVGIASSVNRYVAKFRTTAQWTEMSKTVSCCACIFTGSAIAGLFITIILVYILPWVAPPSFLPYLKETRLLLLCLGLSVCIDLFIPTYVGVISGYQRYELLAIIEATCYVLLMGCIVPVLLFGGSLAYLGALVLGMRIVEAFTKRLIARKLCPQLIISPAFVTRKGLQTVFFFGSKTLLATAANMGLYQGNNILIAYFFGPAAVAVYARSMALITHANKLLFHYGRVFTPSASHFQAEGDYTSLRNLLLQGVQRGALIALPLALILGILGSSLLRIWMGTSYAEIPILPVLALGHFFVLAQVGSFYALMGLDQHGKPGLASFVCAVASLTGSIIMVKFAHVGLLGVAVSVSLAVAVPYLTVIPWLAMGITGISLKKYLTESLLKPILLCLPFIACLVGARLWAGPSDFSVLIFGLGFGGLGLITMYWIWVVPMAIKHQILGFIGR